MRELLDILDERGVSLQKTKRRDEVHRDGDWHSSIHLWIVNGREVLMQKRSSHKESFPSCYDATAAGHVEAGEDNKTAAIRECKEETGVFLSAEEVVHIGRRCLIIENEITGFISREFVDIYIAKVDEYVSFSINEEIESMRWMDLDELRTKMLVEKPGDVCVQFEEIEMIINALCDC